MTMTDAENQVHHLCARTDFGSRYHLPHHVDKAGLLEAPPALSSDVVGAEKGEVSGDPRLTVPSQSPLANPDRYAVAATRETTGATFDMETMGRCR